MKRIRCVILWLLLLPFTAFSQPIGEHIDGMQAKIFNFETFTQDKKVLDDELLRLTPSEYYSHPEFGILPHNAPCQNCYELIQERTDSSRMFVEKGSEGTQFYSQKANGPIHFINENGLYTTYDPRLKEVSDNIYKSNKQDTPIELNLFSKQTHIELKDGSNFEFNKNLTLLYQDEFGVINNLGLANWSDYLIGEEGIRIFNAWPEIDIEIVFSLDKVKTNYIIKSNLGYANGNLIFRDNVVLPEDYTFYMDEFAELEPHSNKRITDIDISNHQGLQILIEKGFGYDQSGIKENSYTFGYDYDGEEFDMYVPINWLNKEELVYPVVIDPVVTSTATYTAGVMRFRFNGSFCPGANADCNYTLNVPRPANATLTGANFSIVHETLAGSCFFACWLSEAGWYFQTTCGAIGYYGCTGSSPGTCTGTNVPFNALVTCLTPVCTGNVPFQIFNSYCYCDVNGNCGNSCQRINNNTWIITITGNTLETLGNTATGNGTTTIAPGNCTGTTTLNPGVNNGVPGYTYSWSTGATSPTIDVPNSPTGTYTVTITDACGVSRTATFNIDVCTSLMSITLNYFQAEQINDRVLIEWETLSEKDNDYFIVQRKLKDGSFQDIKIVKGQMNSSVKNYYQIFDNEPEDGINYYRLISVDINGEKEYSDIVSLLFKKEKSGLTIIPNPSNGAFILHYDFSYSGVYEIEITSFEGKFIQTIIVEIEKGMNQVPVELNGLEKGVYLISLKTKNQVITEKLFIEN